MSPIDLPAIVALIIFAVYRQSRPHELIGSGRFKLAIIYIVAGVVIGGLHPPQEWQGRAVRASRRSQSRRSRAAVRSTFPEVSVNTR